MGMVVKKSQIEKYYEEEGSQKLAAAKKKLDAAGIRYQARILVGDVAETIIKHASSTRCDIIYIGTRGMGALGKALLGSTAGKVVQIADVPVLVVK